ncbi:unnamed protein product [Anisakis simplex]|uniref:Uncharacterized protein n=1 Tax=Anisakis simplex TaxID=6269 RepID=A0A0M3JS53_ANISI|nr:unnamed protein product [Anisakis simplex]
MSAPMPYRSATNNQQYVGSFPPPMYYRDTYGLQNLLLSDAQLGAQQQQSVHNYNTTSLSSPHHRRFTDSVTTVESDDTATTKSTVRTTVNIHNPNLMIDSSTSKGTAMTQSFHVEQMVTNQVLLSNARTLLTLCLVAFGSALQLLVFAIICLFYDGCPYYCAIIASFIFMLNASTVLYFIRYKPTKRFLVMYGEDKKIRGQGWSYYEENLLETNRIVTNTRIAMYSLHMVLTPVQALCCTGILWILYNNLRSIQDNAVTKGFFFSQPPMGHQTVLVPIELKQVETLDESEPENASIGVQTSGNQSNKDTNWS